MTARDRIDALVSKLEGIKLKLAEVAEDLEGLTAELAEIGDDDAADDDTDEG